MIALRLVGQLGGRDRRWWRSRRRAPACAGRRGRLSAGVPRAPRRADTPRRRAGDGGAAWPGRSAAETGRGSRRASRIGPRRMPARSRERRRDRVRPAELSVGDQIEVGRGLLTQHACQLGVALAARIAAVVGERDPHAATIVCARRQRQAARTLTKRCTGRSGRETKPVDRSRRCGRCAQRARVGRAAAMPAPC